MKEEPPIVEVKFFAKFRELLGEKSMKVKAKNLKQLLEIIRDKNEKLKKELFSNPKKLKLNDFVIIMINGERISPKKKLNRKIDKEDVIAIFPPAAGGNN